MPTSSAAVDEPVADLALDAHVADTEGAAGAVPVVAAAFLVFRTLEVGQHVVIAPAGASELAPVVEVGAVAANVEQAVDGARSAEHLAPRPVETAAAKSRARLGLEHPVGARIVHRLEVADRNMDPDVAVVAAGLEQEHAGASVGGQPVGQHASGRAGADNDVVPITVHAILWRPQALSRGVVEKCTRVMRRAASSRTSFTIGASKLYSVFMAPAASMSSTCCAGKHEAQDALVVAGVRILLAQLLDGWAEAAGA